MFEPEQFGSFGFVQFLFALTCCATKPSILPPSISAIADDEPCGPPAFASTLV